MNVISEVVPVGVDFPGGLPFAPLEPGIPSSWEAPMEVMEAVAREESANANPDFIALHPGEDKELYVTISLSECDLEGCLSAGMAELTFPQ